jgi:glycosyltransferase involved in cell wall biosynthesis
LTEREPLHEYVEDGLTALVVPPADPAAVRTALERLLGDGELRARLGRAARARVEREFTTAHMAERFAPVLRSAAA